MKVQVRADDPNLDAALAEHVACLVWAAAVYVFAKLVVVTSVKGRDELSKLFAFSTWGFSVREELVPAWKSRNVLKTQIDCGQRPD